jgi:tetraprenyl-beta-curcumene synthase
VGATIRENRLVLAAAFADAARRYWIGVYPHVRREIDHCRMCAGRIPNPALRELALATQEIERGNLEGAAAFAVLAPPPHRAWVVRALVAYQAVYDYVDTLAEQPEESIGFSALQLHLALPAALGARTPHLDYYADNARRYDGGYLQALADRCRQALETLPSYDTVSAPALRAAERMVAYQALNHEADGSYDALAHWAEGETPSGTGLRWWETAAGAASSLGVFALIAAAARPVLFASETRALEHAYFPWIGALHVLLDSLVDRADDSVTGHHSLIAHYVTPRESACRLKMIAANAIGSTNQLPGGRLHSIIVAAMTSFYLSAPQASAPETRLAATQVLHAMGHMARPAGVVHRVRRAAASRHW